MNAILPPELRTPIPRLTKKKLERQGGERTATGAVQFHGSSAHAVRYQYLPDYDPNESDEQIEEKLKERFAIMRMMTRRSINGKCRALVVSGPGGVGKTFDIDAILEDWDPAEERYTSSSGYVKATGLYKLLWEHRHPGNVLKFDDADSIFHDDTALQFLKIACDTTQRRVLTYGAEFNMVDSNGDVIPRRFEYEGTMVFVSNLDFDVLIDKGTKLAPHLEAMVTRSHYINMGMRTKRDYLIRLFMVANEGLFAELGLSEPEIDDTLKFIETHHRNLRECSLRMGLKIGGLRQMAEEDDEITWDRQAMITCCRPSNVPPPPLPDDDDSDVPQVKKEINLDA